MKNNEYNFQSPEIQVEDVLLELQKSETTTILEQIELIMGTFGICNETVTLFSYCKSTVYCLFLAISSPENLSIFGKTICTIF